MKTNHMLLLAFAVTQLFARAHAQNIAINTDGSLSDTNTIPNIKSANKGILIPRTSSVTRQSMPATKGLLVYDTTTNSFWFNNGTAWHVATRDTGLNALRIHYSDAELAGINEPKLIMYKDSNLTSGYLAAGRDSIDTINNGVVKSGSDSLTGNEPIPVTNPVVKQPVKPEDLNENLSDKIQVFPVPARDYFILTVSGERKQRIEYLLFDEAGHQLQSKKVFMLPGSNSISWDISSYPAGMYYLTTGNGKMQKIRILKQ